MANFSYEAYELSGRKRSGTISALDRDAAMASLSSSGIHVSELKEAESRVGRAKNGSPERSKGGISKSELALFGRRLADLAAAGLPLDRALELAGEQSESGSLKSIAEEATGDVREGFAVSDALAKHPHHFPPVVTLALRAGEASGQFPQVAGRLADLQEREVKRRAEFLGALIYPALLAFTSIVVVGFLMLYVVPRLSDAFDRMGSQLPATTAALMGSSHFLASNAVPILIGVAAIALLGRAWTKTEPGRLALDRFLLNLPIAGKIVGKMAISRYASVLGTLLYGGVPVLESLKIAGAASGNRVVEEAGESVHREVREGKRIADALRDSGAFSNLLVQMVSVGEETGDLPTMLGRVSSTLDFEVDNGLKRLVALFEPVVVLAMGGFVGFVVLSILIPIYQAQDLVR